MQKLIHPITFRKKTRATAWFVFVAVLALLSGYWLISSRNTTVNEAKISLKSGFGDLLTDITNTATPVPYKLPGTSFELPTSTWVPQTFNNCGPAAVSMLLQHFGYNVSQAQTKADLRTNSDDKNVFIGEISNYLRDDYDIQNKVFFNGDLKTIKTLVANGVYVMVEDWLHPNEDIGHVLLIRGFDDTEGVLIADDPYFGVGIKYPYKVWDETQWKPYNREFMPVYTRENEELVKSIIGENWSENKMYRNSVAKNQADTEVNPADMYAWFNLGTSLYELGEYDKARQAFEKSQSLGWPKRMLWYQIQPVQTYNKLGEYQKAITTANLGLWYNDNFAEMHYEKAYAYKNLGDSANFPTELTKAFEFDPNLKDSYNLRN